MHVETNAVPFFSFTGIRLACSTAQGISISQNIRGIVVSSLDILASSINRIESAEKIVSIVDANMGRLYLAEYHYSGQHLKTSKLTSIIVSQLVTIKGFFNLLFNKLSPPTVPSGFGSSIKDNLNLGFIS